MYADVRMKGLATGAPDDGFWPRSLCWIRAGDQTVPLTVPLSSQE